MLPKIPLVDGSWAKYSGTINQHFYEIELRVWGDESHPSHDIVWLEVDVYCGPEFTETSLLRVDRKKFNEVYELEVIEGWTWTEAPGNQQPHLAAFSGPLTVPFEPKSDNLAAFAMAWGIEWPENRLSTHDLLVLLFDARMPAAKESIQKLRPHAGHESRQTANQSRSL